MPSTRAARLATQPAVVDLSAGRGAAIKVYPTGEYDEDGNVYYRETPDGDECYQHESGFDFII